MPGESERKGWRLLEVRLVSSERIEAAGCQVNL
jgi:hypothetical protein